MQTDMKKYFLLSMFLIVGFCGSCLGTLWYQAIEDSAEGLEEQDREVASMKWRQNHFMLSEDNLYNKLIAQGIDFPEIVLAQAILETGHFKSYSCLKRNNLFGLRKGDGTYMSFNHWTESVESYGRYIQKYTKPPNCYYHYLDSLGYAEDSDYINKLKEIVNRNDKRRSE